jgi:monofunctional biosynthetic peptidoglycan transglycosylase
MFRRLLRTLARLVIACVLVVHGLVVAYRFVDPPLTPLMVIRVVEGLVEGRPAGIHKTWTPLHRVSPALLRAVIAAEDARFFAHWGVDLHELRQARAEQLRRGARRRGASTITMQCARNVLLWQGRSYVRKALETYLAVLLELAWGKPRILEVYVNVIEWGRGVYGVEAAARRSFGVGAAELEMRQAALLAAALPSPRRFDPGAPTPYLQRRAEIIARRAGAVRLDARLSRGGR